jgi:mono/diheme cytochrome c family protein
MGLLLAASAVAQDLPEGEGKELVQKKCGSCHGLYKATGENKTEAEWAVEVDKMAAAGAAMTDDEFEKIVLYLAKNFGPVQKK